MADLKTNYKDDVLDTSINDKRKYQMIQNSDGTISLADVTSYTQEGSTFGAADINATNQEVNTLNENLTINGDYKFKVGKDGDGNVCYYGADGSLIPFKKEQELSLIDSGSIFINITGTNLQITIPEKKPFVFSYVGFTHGGGVNSMDNATYKNFATNDESNYQGLYGSFYCIPTDTNITINLKSGQGTAVGETCYYKIYQ